MEPAIEVKSLTKRFGKTVAVDDLSFTVPVGSVVGFLGPNGAGKTTTLRVLLGLSVPTAGEATVEAKRYAELDRPIAAVGAVLDASQFHPGRTGRDHLGVFAKAGGVPTSRVDALLRLVELEDAADRRVRGYSLGMRQRLSLAVALLADPRTLVLDEPANGLDPQGIRWLRDFLRSRRDEGRTVLVSSHVLSEVAQVVDQVVVIDRGRLVAQGPLAELTSSTGAPIRVRSGDPAQLARLLSEQGVTVNDDGAGWLTVRDTTTETVGTVAAGHQIAIYEMVSQSQSLEDIFLKLTTRDSDHHPGADAEAGTS